MRYELLDDRFFLRVCPVLDSLVKFLRHTDLVERRRGEDEGYPDECLCLALRLRANATNRVVMLEACNCIRDQARNGIVCTGGVL